jgi:GNAT superfamily N-acetyltransferase
VNAYRRAGLLRYAAIQFVVLTALAMALYAGGTWFDPSATRYQLTHNFLSDLGATHSFSGRANYAAMAAFAIALVSVGAALSAFAWSWRELATRSRARGMGVASALLGTASGAAFAAIAFAPIDHALDVHNALVVAAFGLLLGYIVCLTVVMWRNAVGRLAINVMYVALVGAYVALVVAHPQLGTERGVVMQVIGQKIVVYVSMLHVIYLTTAIRRSLTR